MNVLHHVQVHIHIRTSIICIELHDAMPYHRHRRLVIPIRTYIAFVYIILCILEAVVKGWRVIGRLPACLHEYERLIRVFLADR